MAKGKPAADKEARYRQLIAKTHEKQKTQARRQQQQKEAQLQQREQVQHDLYRRSVLTERANPANQGQRTDSDDGRFHVF